MKYKELLQIVANLVRWQLTWCQAWRPVVGNNLNAEIEWQDMYDWLIEEIAKLENEPEIENDLTERH